MSTVRVTTVFGILLTYMVMNCIGVSIVNDVFEVILETAPTLEPAQSHLVTYHLECAAFCVQDPNCTMYSTKQTGPGEVECSMFTCWEDWKTAPETGVTSYRKTVTDLVCPAGYTGVCGHCYYYLGTLMTWADAGAHCRSHHAAAYMAEVNSADENVFLQRFIGVQSWLGARLLYGTWTWTHSERTMSEGYESWNPGQPGGPGDCAFIGAYTPTWFSMGCGYISCVLCEYGK